MGSAAAPYLNGTLAGEGALFTNFYAIQHPSAPNYGELYAGDSNGLIDGAPPAGPLTTANLGAELRAAGRSFRS